MWIAFSIMGALAQASGWALKKKSMQNPELNLHIAAISSVTSALIFTASALISAEMKIFDWQLFLIGGISTALLNSTALYFLLRVLDMAELGYVMTWLTITSLTIVIPPIFLLQEIPSYSACGGIALVFSGAYLLENGKQSKNKNHLTKYYLLIIGTCYTLTPTTTKLAIQVSSPILTSAFVYLAVSFLFLTILTVQKSNAKSKIVSLKNQPCMIMVIAGVLSTIENFLLYLAFDMTKVSYVMALKRTAPVFALIIGYFWFSEQFNGKKLTAIACMIAGAVVIGLSS